VVSTSIAWFRRDLRLEDNPAWEAAARAEQVIPLFVVDPGLYGRVSSRRRAVLRSCLESLDGAIDDVGGRLRVEHGDPAQVLREVAESEDVTEIHANRDITPYALARDRKVAKAVSVPIVGHDGLTIQRPGSVVTTAGTPTRVFTPFHRRWLEMPWSIAQPPPDPRPTTSSGAGIPAGESAAGFGIGPAHRRLAEFAERVEEYPAHRDRPDLDDTSRLSIDLKYGSLGPATARAGVDEDLPGGAAWVRQLAWRDFHAQVLAIEPHSTHLEINPRLRAIRWADDERAFSAWVGGSTGYPFVDAAMRQLAAEGFIHNRARMVAASFLVKDLLIDWRTGERHFRRHLLDGDVAQNVGNWQWVAGTGMDAAPFFRIFNPVTQSRKFDPDGTYIRRWIPELRGLPTKVIHDPWSHQRVCGEHGVRIGVDYPGPIVEHGEARRITLDAYESARARSINAATSSADTE
jgi:deoxyribodipyrimidine photo-lyase